jgi:RNA polymerase sigma factor (sigma-70 family)
MPELDDHELLAEFARSKSEAAFAALVARYVNLVYSAALRFTGNPHHAQEITQAVFIILAKKAGHISGKTILSGWLYQTARLTAANFVKGEIRRQRREQEAYMQSTLTEPETDAWQQIAPLLDEAMGKLGETDRNAVVLRFFENKTAQEVAATLKMKEAAAHKRTARAVEKLRQFFIKRGVALPAAAIAGTVSANSVQAAPVGLVKIISAVAIAKGAAAGGSTLALVKGALKIMAWTKTKTAVIAGVVLILAAGTTTVIMKNSGHHPKVKLQWTSAEIESFQQESRVHINQAKQWALACIMFADDHRNQLPKNFEQLKKYDSDPDFSHWEIVSGGNWKSLANPSETILLREKESRPSPDGKFTRAYALADGHVQSVSSPDDDFAAMEKKFGFVVQPAKN